MKQDLWKYSIYELIKGYKKKKFNPVEVVESIINKISNDNNRLNAYVYFNEDSVLKQAKNSKFKLEQNKPIRILEGIPISIKDLIVTKDMPTYRGSKSLSIEIKSNYDAPVVKKLKDMGAIILGKTASPEFGHKGTTQSLKHGVTNNPWNLSYNTGGSSGGSCAAVAAGLGPGSIGTDGGGSIRIPCSFCGLFGHKPTFGKVPAYPLSPFGTIANLGPITRNVKDGGILMNSIASPDLLDWHSLPKEKTNYNFFDKNVRSNFKVGYSKFWGMEKYFRKSLMNKEVLIKIEESISILSASGLKIEETKLIDWPHSPLEIFLIMWKAGAANLARKISKSDLDKLEPSFRDFIEEGKKYTMFDLMDVEAKRAENSIHMKKIYTNLNAIIGPTLPVLPFDTNKNVPNGFPEKDLFSWLPFTYPFNLTKNPASNINVNFSDSGLPIGLQIVTDIHKDKSCFDLAFFIEEVLGITKKWPIY